MSQKGRWIVAAAAVGTALTLLVLSASHRTRHPRVAVEISLQGMYLMDMHFSPDGLTLAVVTHGYLSTDSAYGTRIHRVSDGKLLHELAGGGKMCAWNWDGTLLAVARNHWPDVEVWDSRTWTLKKRLTLLDSSTERPKTEDPLGRLNCTSLCFDRDDNIYVVEWIDYAGDLPHRFPRTSIWWTSGKNRTEITTGPDCSQIGISAGAFENETRLACSYEDCPVQIRRIKTGETSERAIRLEYRIPEIGMPLRARNKPVHSSVALTADGRYLAARDTDNFFLFELLDDHARLIESREVPLGFTPFGPVTVVSRDGRFAAYMAAGQVTAVRIPSAETVLQIDHDAMIALSPNGRLLAAAEFHQHTICLYRIPHNQPIPHRGH